jgi:hypothetical protein
MTSERTQGVAIGDCRTAPGAAPIHDSYRSGYSMPGQR